MAFALGIGVVGPLAPLFAGLVASVACTVGVFVYESWPGRATARAPNQTERQVVSPPDVGKELRDDGRHVEVGEGPKRSVQDAITQAEATYYASSRDQILRSFFEDNVGQLSTDDALRIAAATYYADTKERLIRGYFTHHRETLSPQDVVRLAQATYYASTRDEILLSFAQGNRTLGAGDKIALSKATYYASTRDKILLT